MPQWVFQPEIHDKLELLLFENIRYKVASGGRAARKSYSFADAALARMTNKVITITVCRELDTTIRDSVHKLLKERIAYHHMEKIFDVTDNEIRCINGSLLNYKHLHNNVAEIKGLQGTTICWIFEAENLTKESADVLFPTIRSAEGSEIWIEFNPNNTDDFVYQRFVINPPKNAHVVHLTYLENDKCPQESIDEAEECKRNRPDDYRHIWLGEPANVGSRVYPSFSDKAGVHVRDYNLDKLRSCANFFMGQDPATVYYPFAVWIARIEKKDSEFDYLVYNEFPTLDMMGGKYFHEIRTERVCSLTLKQRATMFRVLDSTIDKSYSWINIEARAIDTRFVKASGAASTTLNTRGLIQTMSDPKNGGMRFETPPENRIDSQRDRIRELLNYDADLGLVAGFNEPHFFVMSHCYNVIDAFMHHRVDLHKKAEDVKRKDPIDAIRIVMALMEEYPQRREEVKQEIIEETDAVGELKKAWLNR